MVAEAVASRPRTASTSPGAARAEFNDLTAYDEQGLVRAPVGYVNLMRVEELQLRTKQPLSNARQHPGVQLRSWLESMSMNRRAKLAGKKPDEKDPMQGFLEGLSMPKSG